MFENNQIQNSCDIEDNRNFDNLTKCEQKVAIAKDVLKYLNSNKFIPRIAFSFISRGTNESFDRGEDLFSTFNRSQCTVCALGSLFLTAVLTKRLDSTCKTTIFYREDIVDELSKFFSKNECENIEDAFEHNSDKVARFALKTPNSKDRLIAIMENIIRNRGNFDLEEEFGEHNV